VDFQRVGPGGETGHDVELAEQAGHHFVGIGLPREMLEVGHYALERLFDSADGLFGEILTLSLQALVMLEELFAVELDER